MASRRGAGKKPSIGLVKVLDEGVILVELKRGQSTKPTDHDRRYIVVPLTNGKMRRDTIQGEAVVGTKTISLKAFRVYRRDDPTRQSVSNVGTSTIRFLKFPCG